jgi:predicted aspartyl protease
MGLTNVHAIVRNPFKKVRPQSLLLLVDSGASYTVLPETVWTALRLAPTRTLAFSLADGTVIERGVSEAQFEFEGQRASSPVVLGGPKDSALLGAVTLETLGLVLNPLTRELLPMRMMMARLRT